MITTILVIVIVVASVTILWGFFSMFLTTTGESGNLAFAGLLKLFSPQDDDTTPGTEVNNTIVYNLTCNDTDSLDGLQGVERFILGNVTILNGTDNATYIDECLNNAVLFEYYCADNSMNSTQITCEGGENSCKDGRCNVSKLVYSCYDSDSFDYGLQNNETFKLGNLTLFNPDYNISVVYSDRCVNESVISESYCVNSTNGESIEVNCGANSKCDNLIGACTCGNLGGVCCPQQKGDPCLGNLECNSSHVCINVTSPLNCGNGVREGNEACDDGNKITEKCAYGLTSCIVCSSSCTNVSGQTSYCQDGITQWQNEEECDDGNYIDNDRCNNNCISSCGRNGCQAWESCASCSWDCGSCPPPVCGNGVCEAGETCYNPSCETACASLGCPECGECGPSGLPSY